MRCGKDIFDVKQYAEEAVADAASVEKACVNSVKVQLVLLELLLKDQAAEAKHIIQNFTPLYNSLEAYLADLDRLMVDKDAVQINDDGTVLIH